MDRIRPERMAAVYAARGGKRAVADIFVILHNYHSNEATVRYWKTVLHFLQSLKGGK